VSAAAALTGLVVVAVSINVETILQIPGLPQRGPETIPLLLGAAIVSPLGLVPAQSHGALGLLLLLAESVAASSGGLYWTFAGTVAALVAGVVNARVLLVEILRRGLARQQAARSRAARRC